MLTGILLRGLHILNSITTPWGSIIVLIFQMRKLRQKVVNFLKVTCRENGSGSRNHALSQRCKKKKKKIAINLKCFLI